MLLLETDDPLIKHAIDFATKAHRGQNRKNTYEPYLTHPLSVADAIKEKYPSASNIVIAAAVLHDVKDNKYITWNVIAEEFGTPIADLVDHLTRKETDSYFVHISKIARGRTDGIIIKLEDCMHNIAAPGSESLKKRYTKAIKILSSALESRLAASRIDAPHLQVT